jgi:flagellar hook-length control protein FliK
MAVASVDATPSQPAPTHQSQASLESHPTREADFAAANGDRVVTAIRTHLLPRGGTMQIRLDPPNLGTLQVAVRMNDGVMSVSFQTSSEEATRLLSHSLSQLKHGLETHGVSVDKLHVQQASRDHDTNRQDADQQRQESGEEGSWRQEQQRRQMLQRMWRRLALGDDPLDLVA